MEIYLDNAATTKVCKAAADAAYDCMINCYGNPSSLHKKGLDAEKRVTAARKILADALSVKEEEIYFTAGSTESTIIGIEGLLAARKRAGKRIVTTAIEHSAVKNTLTMMEKQGYEIVTVTPKENGCYDPMDFALAVNKDTVLVTVMAVNNETGLLLPCDKIGKLIKRANPQVIFHVDATQALGKMKLTPSKWAVDMMSFSGHKIYAPKGIGALYLKKGLRIESPIVGGGQESGIRSGTHNVPGIAAFGAAIEFILPKMNENLAHYKMLVTRLKNGLADLPTVEFNSNEFCAPWIFNLSVVGYRSEIVLHYLESHGVYVSSGSACSVGKRNGVLSALNISDARSDSAIRVSFSYETTPEEIDIFCDLIHSAITELAH